MNTEIRILLQHLSQFWYGRYTCVRQVHVRTLQLPCPKRDSQIHTSQKNTMNVHYNLTSNRLALFTEMNRTIRNTHKSDVWLTVHRNSVWIRNQLDVTFYVIFYFSFTNCSTSFGQPCAHLQELTTA